jgi:hypothetical protein
MAVCTTNYTCVPTWYVLTDVDVIAQIGGPSAPDLNVTCITNTGNVQFQVKDNNDAWFTPADASYTITVSNVIRMPRANMPDMRILAFGDATFSVTGALI